MAINLFGFTIGREDKQQELKNQSFITPVAEDGASTVSAGGYYGTFVDIDASARSESELISRYREISNYPDCDTAIEEIVTEAIAAIDSEAPVSLNLDDLDLSDTIKKSIQLEFNEILSLLDFKDKAHDIFRRWYIDGRVYYQKVIDPSSPKKGIQELRYIDPRKIRKVREVKKEKLQNGVDVVKSIDEFFIYNERGLNYAAGVPPTSANNSGIKISTDAIAFCPSGLLDLDRNVVIGYLHKAIKPVNQLKMMADSLVIYRLARAPERRIFYIDIGNLPKNKAEQYMKDIMTRYRNKIVYDSSTGEIKDDRKFMTMLEDFWLPRREGGRGTEITTLPGGENLGQIADIEFFQNKVYQSLNVPSSRFQQQASGFNFGRAAEISREEMKFAKFISRLRRKFNALFDDLLFTQLILKGVITVDDWADIKEKLNYEYAQDQYYQEIKDLENLRNRIDVVNQMTPYVGTYFSKHYVRKKVLMLSDNDIEQIENENEDDPLEIQPGMPGSEQIAALSRENQQ
jgi:hypothetical protein